MGRRRSRIYQVINAFYDRVEADEVLSPVFPGGVREEHRLHVIAWWCEVFGGPARYTDELGGYERMLAKHHDLAITPEQRFRFASLMSLAADDAKLPEDPEFRSAFMAYVEWGTGSRSTTRSRAPRWWGTPLSHAGGGVRRPRSRHSSTQAGACRASLLLRPEKPWVVEDLP